MKIQKRRKSVGAIRGRQADACCPKNCPSDFVRQRFFGQKNCPKEAQSRCGHEDPQTLR